MEPLNVSYRADPGCGGTDSLRVTRSRRRSAMPSRLMRMMRMSSPRQGHVLKSGGLALRFPPPMTMTMATTTRKKMRRIMPRMTVRDRQDSMLSGRQLTGFAQMTWPTSSPRMNPMLLQNRRSGSDRARLPIQLPESEPMSLPWRPSLLPKMTTPWPIFRLPPQPSSGRTTPTTCSTANLGPNPSTRRQSQPRKLRLARSKPIQGSPRIDIPGLPTS